MSEDTRHEELVEALRYTTEVARRHLWQAITLAPNDPALAEAWKRCEQAKVLLEREDSR